MAPDIKVLLKDAKSAVKDNNFEKVGKCCKLILKHDRNNYQALVMFGRACQEQKKFEDSKKALILASTIEPDNLIAWQGLGALFENQPHLGSPKEIISVNSKLVELLQDSPKYSSLLRKLSTAYQSVGDPLSSASTLMKLIPVQTSEEKKISQEIINLLTPIQNSLSDEWTSILLDLLKKLLNESVLGNNESNYKLYLSLTYKSNDTETMLAAAQSMHKVFPTAYPLEWIARLFVEENLPWNDQVSKISWSTVEAAITLLFSRYSNSLWGNLAIGLHNASVNDLSSAIDSYVIACERSSSNFSNVSNQPIIWWRLLLEAHQSNKDWSAMESTAILIVRLLIEKKMVWPGENEDTEKVVKRLQLLRAMALMKMGHNQHYSTALELLRKLDPSKETKIAIINCLMHVDLPNAKKEIEDSVDFLEKETSTLLSAKLKFLEKEFEEAKEILENIVNSSDVNAESLLLLGQVYQSLGENNKSLSCLLKAAKLDSSQSQVFLYLGHHYRRANDKQKACKCYQKAHLLSPNGEEEGKSLSDIYRELGEHNKNFSLLTNATKNINGGGSWAWFRMGLHYLSILEPQMAISSLQRCLQLDPNNRGALESLGDAYLSRGSYVAARKVYERVLSLNSSTFFPKCQIAKIHLCTGEPMTSVEIYEKVLEECKDDNVRSMSLLGLAHAYFILASNHASTNHFENTLKFCSLGIKMCDELRELQPNSASVWKCLGDLCSLLHCLPDYLAVKGINVPSRLIKSDAKDEENMEKVKIQLILELSTKCYGAVVQLNSDDANAWHDLGLGFYFHAKYLYDKDSETGEMVKPLMQKASNCIRKSLALAPNDSDIWNSLGVICVHKAIDNKALAQHCFIRSIQLKPTTTNWTHLGALYLIGKESQLAYQAFRQGQAMEPRSVSCWTGQALVAEIVKHYDTADLFRHCCTLGIHPESCLGHGHFVLEALGKKETVSPQVLSLAADAMLFYSREFDSDPVGLNLAGLCLEEHGMIDTASKLYSSALSKLTESDPSKLLDAIKCNLGRALTILGNVKEAATQLSGISEPDVQSECLLALACLKGSDFETGYTKYMSALHWLAQDPHQKANVLVALACLQYKFKKIPEAKTLLFESCGEAGGCVPGILALGALGLVEGDGNLVSAALNELVPFIDDANAVHNVALLSAIKAMVSGEPRLAKNIVSTAILKHPNNPSLRRYLAWILLFTGEGKCSTASKGIFASSSAATALSQSAGCLSGDKSSSRVSRPALDGVMRVLALMKSGDNERSVKEAQRCIVMYPGEDCSWASLIAACTSSPNAPPSTKELALVLARVWAPKSSLKVSAWMNKVVAAAG